MPTAINPAATLEHRLAELQQTDGEAFMEALYRAYYRPLATTAARVVQDRAAAEDLVQEVLLTVWKNRRTLVVTTTYQAYLTRAVLYAALRYAARQKRQVGWDETSPPEAGRNTTEEHVYGQEAEAAVAAALATLPPQCRTVFLLSRQEGLSYQQIAEALEVAPKTVENQMGKALRLLRQGLKGLLPILLLW